MKCEQYVTHYKLIKDDLKQNWKILFTCYFQLNYSPKFSRVCSMIQLIKKGGLRERANRSRTYQGSENTEKTLKPNRYRDVKKEHEQTQTEGDEFNASSAQHQPTTTGRK